MRSWATSNGYTRCRSNPGKYNGGGDNVSKCYYDGLFSYHIYCEIREKKYISQILHFTFSFSVCTSITKSRWLQLRPCVITYAKYLWWGCCVDRKGMGLEKNFMMITLLLLYGFIRLPVLIFPLFFSGPSLYNLAAFTFFYCMYF